MLEQEILDGNCLIADFMQIDYSGKEQFMWRPGAYIPFTEKCLRYHSSWDWLMPVISKCLSELDFLLRKNIKDEYTNDDWEHMSIIAGYKEKFKWCFERPIKEKCFNLTVEFIKWYNQNK